MRTRARLRSSRRWLALGLVAAAVLPLAHARAARTSAHARAAAGTPTQSFHSEPNLHPPTVSVSSDPDTSSGDIFLTPQSSEGGGLMILSPEGHLEWYESDYSTFNLEVQSYQGHPVLTWYQKAESGDGEDVIMNRSYQTVAVLRAANGYQTDPHDFQITPQGTAWVVARTPVKANLKRYGGSSDGVVWDSVIQELAIPSGKLLWQWHAYGHIPLNASYKPPNGMHYDAYHINAVQPLPDGNLLVSCRNTWSVYKISTKTGQIMWTLGGKYNQFKFGPGAQFEWQHDARRTGNTLTVFDDADSPQEEPQSSAKELALHVSQKTVTLIHSYIHSPPLLSPAQGSTQILPNGDVFVGWGTEPDFSEYTSGGKQILTGSFALGVTSYRALRFHWAGQPATPPTMAAAVGSTGTTSVWASWDGATDVAAWRVLGGATPSSLETLTTKPDFSFETAITLSSQPKYLEVEGLNAHGQTLGTSAVHSLG